MAVFRRIPMLSRQRVIGTRTLANTALPLGLKRLKVSLSRENWGDTSKDVVDFKLALSLDGGKTWVSPFIGFTAKGGVSRRADGTISNESSIEFNIPEPRNPNRMIRTSLKNMIALRFALTLEER